MTAHPLTAGSRSSAASEPLAHSKSRSLFGVYNAANGSRKLKIPNETFKYLEMNSPPSTERDILFIFEEKAVRIGSLSATLDFTAVA